MAILGTCQHCKYYGVMDNHHCSQEVKYHSDKYKKIISALRNIQELAKSEMDTIDLKKLIADSEKLTRED